MIFIKETNLTLSPGNMDAREERMILVYILISSLDFQQEIHNFRSFEWVFGYSVFELVV